MILKYLTFWGMIVAIFAIIGVINKVFSKMKQDASTLLLYIFVILVFLNTLMVLAQHPISYKLWLFMLFSSAAIIFIFLSMIILSKLVKKYE